ncbi:DUF6461 domain-containing protein [Acrocarpospora macrocephala]|nr:DUF6461 domain-containing protein [Acrocarpospora macrocephala]
MTTRWPEILEYYRMLLDEEKWLSSAMCWTAVEGGQSLTEIAVRVSGRPELEGPRDIHELPHGEKLTVSAGLVPPAVVLFEAGGFLGSHPPVLKRLSTDSDVYSVFWDIDGNNYLSRASQGRLLTRLDVTEPEEWPDGCEEAWPELRRLHQADEDDWQATALAVVELSTGRRLTREWLRKPHHFFQATWPLTYENATPPPSRATGGFGTPAGLMESVIADFEFGDFLVVHEALASLRAGSYASEELMMRIRLELVQVMTADFYAHDEGEMEDNPRWRRMQAALALSMAVEEPGIRPPGFGVFNHAELAYGDQWAQVKERLGLP